MCPTCKEPLHPGSFMKRLWRLLVAALTRSTSVECPLCHQPAAAKSNYCMRCGCDFDIGAALIPLLRPLRRRWDDLVTNASPGTRRLFRITYVFGSAILFCLVLGFSE